MWLDSERVLNGLQLKPSSELPMLEGFELSMCNPSSSSEYLPALDSFGTKDDRSQFEEIGEAVSEGIISFTG